jgi:hypothetical protein
LQTGESCKEDPKHPTHFTSYFLTNRYRPASRFRNNSIAACDRQNAKGIHAKQLEAEFFHISWGTGKASLQQKIPSKSFTRGRSDVRGQGCVDKNRRPKL